MERIIVKTSRKKLFWLLFGAVILTGLSLMAIIGIFDAASRSLGPVGNKIIGIIGLLFFGFCSFFLLKKFFDKTPALVFEEAGFTDNSSALAVGFVGWDEIISIANAKIAGQNFIAIMVSEPEKYLQSGSAWQKKVKRKNFDISGAPILISANTVQMPHEELMDLFLQFAQKSRE